MAWIQYEFQIVAQCPVADVVDVYEATLRCREQIDVEKILQHVAPYALKKIYQEHLTQELAALLPGKLKTVGTHSGVRTTVTVGP